jgi:proto-oncogene C-crk
MTIADRLHGMNDVIGQKPLTATSQIADFNAADEDSWLFDELTREEAISTLQNQTDGTFLVRPSSTIKGDLVLCVKEGLKVSHYIINVSEESSKSIYKIGDKTFSNMKDLLNFYKQRLLDTSPLVRIHPKPRVRTKYRFDGKDEEDLPFKKGQILMIIKKVEPLWWLARNSLGDKGMIPANYVEDSR